MIYLCVHYFLVLGAHYEAPLLNKPRLCPSCTGVLLASQTGRPVLSSGQALLVHLLVLNMMMPLQLTVPLVLPPWNRCCCCLLLQGVEGLTREVPEAPNLPLADLEDPNLWACLPTHVHPSQPSEQAQGSSGANAGSRQGAGFEAWLCRLAGALITHCTDPLLLMLHRVVVLKVICVCVHVHVCACVFQSACASAPLSCIASISQYLQCPAAH